MRSGIAGTGSYIPECRVTNDMLAARMDTSDEWIVSRTGIRERHLSAEGTAAMAAEAARRALADAGMTAEELDWILVATVTPECFFPSVACQVQEVLGAKKAVCYDLSAACSGFLFGLQTADAYIRTGMARNVLVIGAEAMSRLVDWKDRSTCVLFGDGAGAAVVTAVPEGGIRTGVLGCDGSRGNSLICSTGRSVAEIPFLEGTGEDGKAVPTYLAMDGRQIFQFAVRTVPEAIREALAQAEISTEDVSLFLLHQANARILTSIGRSLHVPMEKIPENLAHTGNLAAASVPVLLDEVNRAGRLQRGDTLVLAGFGAGLTWGAMVLEW